MEQQRHIALVTGSRADYGLLLWPIRRILEETGCPTIGRTAGEGKELEFVDRNRLEKIPH